MLSDFKPELKCCHCGDDVIFTGQTIQGFYTDYLHANMVRRCLTSRSGKAYGLEADISIETRA